MVQQSKPMARVHGNGNVTHPNQAAHLILTTVLQRVGMGRKDFLDALSIYGYVYSESDFANWNRPRRYFPRDPQVQWAMLRVLVEGLPVVKRCTPTEALRFLSLIGYPFSELGALVTLFDSVELVQALTPYLPGTIEPNTRDEALNSLRKAYQTLSQIDVPDLPPPGPQPANARMALWRNPFFTGRRTELRELAQAVVNVIQHPGTAARSVAISGFAGMGKTQLACEFVYRYGQFFVGGVFWLSCENPAAIAAEIALCGHEPWMNLGTHFVNLSLDEQVQRVRMAWQAPVPRLLIFDGCTDAETFSRWAPLAGGAFVIVTTRQHDGWEQLGVHTLPLQTLDPLESRAMLETYCPSISMSDAGAVATYLGHLPLALHLAGSYLARSGDQITVNQYLNQLRTLHIFKHTSFQEQPFSPTQYTSELAQSFGVSYEQLQPDNARDWLARELLLRATYFAPNERVPRALLLQTVAQPVDEAGIDVALARLRDLGLVDTDGYEALRVHQLVVAFLHLVPTDGEAQHAVEDALIGILEQVNQRRMPTQVQPLMVHLRWRADAAQSRIDRRAYLLCLNVGRLLFNFGQYHEARPYLERALAISEMLTPRQSELLIQALHALGTLLRDQGEYGEAQSLLERALRESEAMYGKDQLPTARLLTDVGWAASLQSDNHVAKQAFVRALTIQQTIQDADQAEVAQCLTNLGQVLYEQGHFHEARTYFEQALAIQEHLLGEHHPDTALTLNNLGVVLHDQEEYGQAEHYYRRVIAVRSATLGEDHPHLALTINNLGYLLRDQGRYDEARQYLARALEIRIQAYGEYHTYTAESYNNLGRLLHLQGRFIEAQTYYEQALKIRQHIHKETHSDTAKVLHNLGTLAYDLGEYQQAQAYFEQALLIREVKLGKQHAEVAQTLYQLGLTYIAQGNSVTAQGVLARAVAINEALFEPGHSSIEAARAALMRLPPTEA